MRLVITILLSASIPFLNPFPLNSLPFIFLNLGAAAFIGLLSGIFEDYTWTRSRYGPSSNLFPSEELSTFHPTPLVNSFDLS